LQAKYLMVFPLREDSLARHVEAEVFRARLVLPNDVTLSFLRWPIARPVQSDTCCLLIHGFSDGAAVWNGVARHLVKHCDVVAPDLRGHGESDWDPEGCYDIASYGDDLVLMLRAMGIRKIVLVGHSMGGSIALYLYHLMPESILGLALLDCAPVIRPAMRERIRCDFVEGGRTYRSLNEYCNWLMAKRPLSAAEDIRRLASATLKETPEGTFRRRCDPLMGQGGMMRFDLPEPVGNVVDFIRTIHCETLFVRGQASGVLERENHRAMAEAARRPECHEISGAGHAVMSDNPIETAERVGGFVGRLLGKSLEPTP
jgi:pimeloyl-ACP methyl ester carboxylesterase